MTKNIRWDECSSSSRALQVTQGHIVTTWVSSPLPIRFLLYLAGGVMNSSFWKMGIAKNRPLLLLLFVPGSSRASVRSTATDDREDLTIPLSLPLPLFVLLIHLGCSPCNPSCSTSLDTNMQPFALERFSFSKTFCVCPSLVVLRCPFQGSLVRQTVRNWHLYHPISAVIKFSEVALFVCSSMVVKHCLVTFGLLSSPTAGEAKQLWPTIIIIFFLWKCFVFLKLKLQENS